MAGPTDHNTLHELSGLYVLGSLSREDRAMFETHLAGCAACADEVRSLTRVSGALAQLPPQIPPSPALRQRVLASVGGLGGTAGPAVAAPSRGFGGWSWLAAAASLVLAAGLGAYATQLRGRIGALENQLREATLRAEANELQMADLRRVSAEAQSQVGVLAAPDLARVESCRPTSGAGGEGPCLLEPLARPRVHGVRPSRAATRPYVSALGRDGSVTHQRRVGPSR